MRLPAKCLTVSDPRRMAAHHVFHSDCSTPSPNDLDFDLKRSATPKRLLQGHINRTGAIQTGHRINRVLTLT